MKRSHAVIGAAAFAVASIGTVMMAGSASAAPAKASAAYNGACGSGFSVVNSAPIANKGTVYLTYNKNTGENCVVTVRNTTGAKVYMVAWVQLADDEGYPREVDAGEYTSYAGPVYVAGKGYCVNWGGTIDNQTVELDGTNCGALAKAAH